MAGMRNFTIVPVITLQFFVERHCGTINMHKIIPGKGTLSLMLILRKAHFVKHLRACKATGRQFITRLGIQHRPRHIEVGENYNGVFGQACACSWSCGKSRCCWSVKNITAFSDKPVCVRGRVEKAVVVGR